MKFNENKMTQETVSSPKRSNSYNIFILILTVLSLIVVVVMLLPLSEQTRKLLSVYDNLICVIFLIDFTVTMRASPNKSDYFIKERGWLDLPGSIPSFGISQYGGLLRLARLSRFARITHLMRGENKKELITDVLTHRSQYAGFLTILLRLSS
jgi:voltage-gated potassium channel